MSPFNFDLSAKIFSNGDEQIRRYETGKFWQVIRIGGKLALICVESTGTIEKPKLSVVLKTNSELTEEDQKAGRGTICSLFNLDFDLTEFYRETRDDKTMASLATRLRGLKSLTTQYAFEALVDAIVEQQISLKVANAFERRIVKKWGNPLVLEGETYYAYPTPKRLSSATQQELRGVGLSERKAEYVKNVSSMISDGKLDLEALKDKESVDEIVEELDNVRGIGVWTAEFTILRGMHRLQALPADDLGLRRTISQYYCAGKPITSAEARNIAENWGKWKGLGAYYLVVAATLGMEPSAI